MTLEGEENELIGDPCDVLLKLLAQRRSGKTVCPSEVARALAAVANKTAAPDWREMMPEVHAAVDSLVATRRVRISWKGRVLDKRAGPYRIGHVVMPAAGI